MSKVVETSDSKSTKKDDSPAEVTSNEQNEQENTKRKRSEALSSTSELEQSVINEKGNKGQKPKKKKSKKVEIGDINVAENPEEKLISELSEVIQQMKQMNTRLERMENSMKKMDVRLDGTVKKGSIRETMKDLLTEMKDELLKSLVNRIEILEGKLYEKEEDSDDLKDRIESLEKAVKDKEEENTSLMAKLAREEELRKKGENVAEQYSRRNNIKVRGLADDNPNETATESAKRVIDFLKEREIIILSNDDIDIAHRLPNKQNKNRDIIVKLLSRRTKDIIMNNRKLLRKTGVFINDDLTRLNLHALMCVKKKQPDEIEETWWANGVIKYRNKQGRVHTVRFENYQERIDLPWQ